mmetsp:Transcript_41588/g.133720  ORF Transcript_41588/g.133720 Transcript_41588/m.133720 type:complete len:224 (+) Transcript_41588:2301-2972(+)
MRPWSFSNESQSSLGWTKQRRASRTSAEQVPATSAQRMVRTMKLLSSVRSSTCVCLALSGRSSGAKVSRSSRNLAPPGSGAPAPLGSHDISTRPLLPARLSSCCRPPPAGSRISRSSRRRESASPSPPANDSSSGLRRAGVRLITRTPGPTRLESTRRRSDTPRVLTDHLLRVAIGASSRRVWQSRTPGASSTMSKSYGWRSLTLSSTSSSSDGIHRCVSYTQ